MDFLNLLSEKERRYMIDRKIIVCLVILLIAALLFIGSLCMIMHKGAGLGRGSFDETHQNGGPMKEYAQSQGNQMMSHGKQGYFDRCEKTCGKGMTQKFNQKQSFGTYSNTKERVFLVVVKPL
jgi:hypothetical protein